MASHSPENIMYFLEIPKEQEAYLGSIRKWENLKVAFEEDSIWIKDFSMQQIEAKALKKIPAAQQYYSKNGKLFKLGDLLPDRNEPAFLWTPIQRAIQLELPKLNYNFFGLKEGLQMSLIPAKEEKESYALLCDIALLKKQIIKMPSIRLKNLAWCILDDKKALIIGTPLLPIKGTVFWKENDFLIPAGYDFEWSIFSAIYNQKINPKKENWLLWQENNACTAIAKKHFKPLTISNTKQH